ncbi:MAG: hypothetical protein JNM30_13635 [Rhodospirillales bacterium]|nr:hypothetical protein [Rhodospirillales bacterium]
MCGFVFRVLAFLALFAGQMLFPTANIAAAESATKRVLVAASKNDEDRLRREQDLKRQEQQKREEAERQKKKAADDKAAADAKAKAAATAKAKADADTKARADAKAKADADAKAKAAQRPVVVVPRDKYPESAKHIEDAQKAGKPAVVTIDRQGAAQRRAASMQGQPRQPGKDRDEYPPAMFKEGGKGSSVRPVPPSDNRGAGACIGAQCRKYPDNTKVELRTQ